MFFLFSLVTHSNTKLVMASDQLGSIQRPLVNVDFDITQDGQRTFESIELSKEELESFISSLEAANKVRLCVCGL